MRTLQLLALFAIAAPVWADRLVLEVPGVDGESTVAGYEDEIDVESYGFSSSGFPGGSSTTFTVSGLLDRSFPQLLEKCLAGDLLGTVRLSLISESTGSPHAELELTSARCTSVVTSLAEDLDRGTQDCTFSFADASWQHLGGATAMSLEANNSTGPRRRTRPDKSPLGYIPDCSPDRLFLKLPDIKGGSDADGFKDWIDSTEATWGVANEGGVRIFYPLSVRGYVDKAFPSACGELFDETVLDKVEFQLACKSQFAFEVELEKTKIRSVESWGRTPRFNFSLDEYERVKVTYKTYDDVGSVTGTFIVGWDLVNDQPYN